MLAIIYGPSQSCDRVAYIGSTQALYSRPFAFWTVTSWLTLCQVKCVYYSRHVGETTDVNKHISGHF